MADNPLEAGVIEPPKATPALTKRRCFDTFRAREAEAEIAEVVVVVVAM